MSFADDGPWYHYTVRSHRYDGPYKLRVWVGDEYGHSVWGRTVCLKEHWWHHLSVGERVRMTLEKAQAVADKRNHEMLYINHDVDKAVR